MSVEEFDPAALECGRRLFTRPCRFVMGVAKSHQLPPPGPPEIAFAGRSNVGKSSLLNALIGHKAMARTSNTPGRTRELNFFDLDGVVTLVDLPGYGYARASKTEIRAWTDLLRAYLRGRVDLARVMLLIDSRHGIKPSDLEIMAMLDAAAVLYQIVLTKADKQKKPAIDETIGKVCEEAAKHAAAYPFLAVTSARTGRGIEQLRATVAAIAGLSPEEPATNC